MNWIIRYFFAREIYRKFNNNRAAISDISIFENIGKFCWYVIFLIFIISLTYSFAIKNDLKPSEIAIGDSIFFSSDNSNWKKEISVFQMITEVNSKSNIIDTILQYNKSYHYDSTGIAKLAGVATGVIIKNSDKNFVELTRSKDLKLSDPIYKDLNFKKIKPIKSYNYINIDDLKLRSTKNPEERWFIFFILVLTSFIMFKKFASSIVRYFKKSIPVYGSIPIVKTDRRFKSGERVVGYRDAIIDYKIMSIEDLATHKKQQLSKMLIYLLILAGLWSYVIYLVNT